ncbi:MAG: hypothetical protein M1828_006907 [Chrysothrix sp. TS-e1954]|nr:MAG: hypothetical protein M1828_006907 [Chrysothrix sp. TS-e1954]
MATSTSHPQTSPFTRCVTNAMRTLYPEHLADHSFDNTGLLLQAPWNRRRAQKPTVLLTIDLTRAVASEAIEKGVDCIVAYHPIIFRGLKKLTFEDPQQTSLLRLAQEGISVYCPHTAVDSAEDGNADWLADIITDRGDKTVLKAPVEESQACEYKLSVYRLCYFPRLSYLRDTPPEAQDSAPFGGHLENEIARRIIEPTSPGATTGHGRLLEFTIPRDLSSILRRLTDGLGTPRALSLALPYGTTVASHNRIFRIALCAGSGSSVFSKLSNDDGKAAHLYITGEMSHHEALAATERGICVICLGHSNSERGYLWNVMQRKLTAEVRNIWETVRAEDMEASTFEGEVEVEVSMTDRDPFGTLVRENRYRAP